MSELEFSRPLAAESTAIPGLLLFDLPVHGDSRGWFKENWQRAKMTALGLPDFGPVQNNVSFNEAVGTTRGIHAEPWDKWISVATGRVFGVWVDMREGDTFGTVVTAVIDPTRAVFVPRGVGNGFQTLEPDTAYTYLVNEHWSPKATYALINAADPTLGIDWPIPLDQAERSDKDRGHPPLAEIEPIARQRILITGGDGQLGRALLGVYDDADVEFAGRADLDLTSPTLATDLDWTRYDTIINAAAYTAVDTAETPEGREAAWAVNASAVAALAAIAHEHNLTLVHVSTDYVYDGTKPDAYLETDPVSPVSVYGQSKAAGDIAAGSVPRHYILRTSWVIGDGNNFVRTMRSLADRGIDPAVVADQRGRLTFATDLATAIRHLLDTDAAPGIYNVTGSGDPMTWADIARTVFDLTGHDPARVRPVTTAEYYATATTPIAPRPTNSVLDLTKLTDTGHTPPDTLTRLREYLV